jgi:hypothetical protein
LLSQTYAFAPNGSPVGCEGEALNEH